MTRKVIYISPSRLTDKTSRDWYIDFLIGKGVAVEYWDVVALIRDDYAEAAAKTTGYLRIFKTYSEVEAMLDLPENKNAYYVMLVSYAGFTVKLFRLLSKHDCKMLFMAWGATPTGRFNKWRIALSGFSSPLRLAKKTFFKAKAIACKKLKLIKPFDIVFAAGQVLLTGNHYAYKVIPMNAADYDQYQKINSGNLAPIVSGRYAVFLDIYLPYHADAKVVGWSSVKPDAYYASLNQFFALLEKKYNIEIVIAAHPRADYRTLNPFNGRRIFHGRTPELVKDADFVISHSSTSQSYAILNQKPIVFIYTNEMLSVYRYTYMNEIYDAARHLNAAIYNIDEISNSEQITIKAADPECYESYKYNYLTSPESEHVLTQEIFWHAIEMS